MLCDVACVYLSSCVILLLFFFVTYKVFSWSSVDFSIHNSFRFYVDVVVFFIVVIIGFISRRHVWNQCRRRASVAWTRRSYDGRRRDACRGICGVDQTSDRVLRI